MKEIKLLSIHMENFKKFHAQTIKFGENVTSIFGQNYKGKSSVADAFSWVLFNKSSTGNTEGSQFRPRRYDENGINIDHVDVMVELLLLVDGNEVKIKKVQRQKWVRHRGDDYDSYEGDETIYEWNDVPVTPTNHKKKVEDIISEEVFRMISNPASFPSIPAKKQREFLLNNVAKITDDDVFASSPEFEPVRAAMGSNTLEELIAKTKKEIAAYKKKQEELPARIDQESKHIEDVDFSKQEKYLADLENSLAKKESEIEDTGKAYEELNTLQAEKARMQSELYQIKSSVEEESREKKRELESSVNNASNTFNTIHEKQKNLENNLQIKTITVESKQKELSVLREEYTAEMNKTFDEDSLICPTCGQEMPEEQANEIRKDFDTKKESRLNTINEKGHSINAELSRLKEDISFCEKEIADLKKEKVNAMGEKNKAMQELEEFNNAPSDLTVNKDYMEAKKQIEDLEEKIKAVNTSDADELIARLKEERATIQASIDEVKEKLALKSVIEKSKQTVKELQEEMTMVTQSIADREKLEKQIEKFNKAKMDMLSDKINEKFKVVKWKLFDLQKNGRYADVCVCQINGSDYGENTTSATERMMAGMDIIRTLQSIYEVAAPIFLDDADLYNDWNIPAMDCQLIKLCVSADEEIRVEVE